MPIPYLGPERGQLMDEIQKRQIDTLERIMTIFGKVVQASGKSLDPEVIDADLRHDLDDVDRWLLGRH